MAMVLLGRSELLAGFQPTLQAWELSRVDPNLNALAARHGRFVDHQGTRKDQLDYSREPEIAAFKNAGSIQLQSETRFIFPGRPRF